MIEEPPDEGRGWELPIGLVLGVVAVVWFGWHEGNVLVGVLTFVFVAFLSVLFFLGRRGK